MIVHRYSDKPAGLGEGPIWDHRTATLYWVDIERGTVWAKASRQSASIIHQEDDYVSGVWLADDNHLLVAGGNGFMLLSTAGGNQCSLRVGPALRPNMRFNDGAVDSQGRLLIGTMGREEADFVQPLGSLFRVGLGNQAEMLITGLTISNGIGWSPDGGTLYVADTIQKRILTIPYAELEGPVSADDCESINVDGLPDGLCVRDDGDLLVALITSGLIVRLSPSGRVLEEISLPVSCPTACCFGGDELNALFVTTSTHLLSDDHSEPDAGFLLELEGAGTGRPEHLFCVGDQL